MSAPELTDPCVILPSGQVMTAELARLCREIYRSGARVHMYEITADRDQDAYLECNRRYRTSRDHACTLLEEQFPALADRVTLTRTFAGPDSWTVRYGGTEYVTVAAALQTGYVLHQHDRALRAGMSDEDAIWTYLALQSHPVRHHANNFYVSETVTDHWTELASDTPRDGLGGDGPAARKCSRDCTHPAHPV